MKLTALFILAGALLSGCERPASTDVFPLEADMTWRYKVTRATQKGTSVRYTSMTNLGPRVINGATRYLRRTSGGTEYHFEKTAEGVTRVAKRLIVETEPQADVPPRLVLPADPANSRYWQTTTHPYVLTRLVSDGIDMRRAYAVPMSYRVEATDATVTVPAGRFEQCIHVIGEAELQMYVDGPTGLRSIPLTTEEWYAPGAGLVKLTRTEAIESNLLASGSLDMELVSLERH